MIKKPLGFIEYYGYIFCMHTLLAGPSADYWCRKYLIPSPIISLFPHHLFSPIVSLPPSSLFPHHLS